MTSQTEDVSPASPRLSLFPTVLSTVFLLVVCALFGWHFFTSSRLDAIPSPGRALALVASRTMDLENALTRAPRWERFLYDGTDTRTDVLKQLIDWYHELNAHFPNLLSEVPLALLETEAGLERPLWRGMDPAMLGKLVRILRPGWFYDRLIIKLANQSSNKALAVSIEKAAKVREDKFLFWNRVALSIDFTLLFLGAAALFFMFSRPQENCRIGTTFIPPSWQGFVGATILIRSAATGMLLGLAFAVVGAFFGMNDSQLSLLFELSLALPLMVMIRRHLLEPFGLRFSSTLGLTLESKSWLLLGLAVLAGLGALEIGDWFLSVTGSILHISSHWAEGFDPDMIWGRPLTVGLNLMVAVVVAPLIEEILFRGLFFVALRRKFGWFLSAVFSSAVFASVHGYGLLGWADTFWSGMVWAWLYERTRSLLPCYLTHSTYNLLASLAMLLLRVDA